MLGLKARVLITITIVLTVGAIYIGTPQSVQAQERGVALFAMQSPKFPCEQALSFFQGDSPLTALSILMGTFGSEQQCLIRWAELMRTRDVPFTLQIHLGNETCRRGTNRACGVGELSPKLSVKEYNQRLEQQDAAVLKELDQRILITRQLAEHLKQRGGEKMHLILSTGLEDNFSEGAYRRVLEQVRKGWPYEVVRNPVEMVKHRPQLSADLYELHGNTPPFDAPSSSASQRCIANLDGIDIVFPHRRSPTKERISWEAVQQYVATYRKRCRITFLWSAPWQGLLSDKFLEPQQRRYVISNEDVAAIRSVAR